jgi:hydroxypyruvate reductase
VICLISGGGSALMSAPQPGVSLSDLRGLTSALLACGARIDEINTLRRHLDGLKGGGLARLAAPAKVVSLILSDVVGNPLEAIASGPTAPDPSSRADALGVLEKYDLTAKVPQAILDILKTAPETPKPGDGLFERVQNVIVGSNALAAESALSQARSEGFHPQLLGNDWQGEAREVARELSQRLIQSPLPRPFCLIAGGETTVTLRGNGLGGRNQELALAAVRELAGRRDTLLVSLATDGEDGPTDAAGAVVSAESLQRGLDQGLSPETFLDDNDAYHYFSALEDLLKPGPTGTNVNDVTFCFGL